MNLMKNSRITLGMQCFWGAEAHFGWLSGVSTTRVGYAGGSTNSPTYRNLADHIEVVDVEFDSSKITLPEILKHFFIHHDPTVRYKRQYESAILYRDNEQQEQIAKFIENDVPGQVVTGVYPLKDFHEAENYHQKYFLRKNKLLLKELGFNDRELIDSPIAAKLNAFNAGFGKMDQFDEYINSLTHLNISQKSINYMKDQIRTGPLLTECGI